MLVGQGPVIVRHNGKVNVLGATQTVEAFEKKHWLRP
jgi:hypothetical protein